MSFLSVKLDILIQKTSTLKHIYIYIYYYNILYAINKHNIVSTSFEEDDKLT
jgi:hypothetical protein